MAIPYLILPHWSYENGIFTYSIGKDASSGRDRTFRGIQQIALIRKSRDNQS